MCLSFLYRLFQLVLIYVLENAIICIKMAGSVDGGSDFVMEFDAVRDVVNN